MKDVSRIIGKRVIIGVHVYLPSIPGENIKKFLLESGVGELLYITHPLLYIKDFPHEPSGYQLYKSSRLKASYQGINWKLPEALLYIKDVVYTLVWSWRSPNKYDLFFGIDPLNAFAGLLLKWSGKVDKVVFYTIDYMPQRFANRILNWVYHAVDSFCVRYADETWNVSPMMQGSRKEHKNLTGKPYDRQYIVPGGIWFDQARRKPISGINKKKLIFTGNLAPVMGVDLAIRSMPQILKSDKKIILEIIGGGQELNNLQNLTAEMYLQKNVIFRGWVGDRKKLELFLSDAAVGIAPFNTGIETEFIKNGDPGKIKDYLLLGLPVVVTRAFAGHQDMTLKKYGIVIDYNEKQFAEAILRLLGDASLFSEYRKNAIKKAKSYDWSTIMRPNFERIFQ